MGALRLQSQYSRIAESTNSTGPTEVRQELCRTTTTRSMRLRKSTLGTGARCSKHSRRGVGSKCLCSVVVDRGYAAGRQKREMATQPLPYRGGQKHTAPALPCQQHVTHMHASWVFLQVTISNKFLLTPVVPMLMTRTGATRLPQIAGMRADRAPGLRKPPHANISGMGYPDLYDIVACDGEAKHATTDDLKSTVPTRPMRSAPQNNRIL